MIRFCTYIVALLFASTTVSSAQELYGAAIPSNAAFARAIGFDGPFFVEELGLTLADDASFEVILESDVITAGQVVSYVSFGKIVHDKLDDTSKVQIAFINDGYANDLTLATIDGGIEILTVQTDDFGFREVNPLSISLGIFEGPTLISESLDVRLDRGNNLTFFVDSAGKVQVIDTVLNWVE